jgi:hypothetical protein
MKSTSTILSSFTFPFPIVPSPSHELLYIPVLNCLGVFSLLMANYKGRRIITYVLFCHTTVSRFSYFYQQTYILLVLTYQSGGKKKILFEGKKRRKMDLKV